VRQAARGVATRRSDPGLFTGFTGVAWVVTHLANGDADGDEDDGVLAVDRALRTALARPTWLYGYDLISGLAGIACYAADRQHVEAARECLDAVIRVLEREATTTPNGITWFTTPERSRSPALRRLFPRGYCDLGVAHGQPGVVGALAYLLRSGFDAPPVRCLLAGACEWLASQISDCERVPEVIGYPETRSSDRLTWCYGRLGLAIALLGAARSLGDDALEKLALDIAECAAGHTRSGATVADAGLCHGPAGAAFLFGQLYRATGRDPLRAAAVQWIETTLAGCEASDALMTDRSVLTGAAGIGLALISALHGEPPAWARIFLADIAQARS
jgi:class I lanthipeptide synthase